MYDYNASLGAVDDAMTLLEHYRTELSDIRAASAFALTDLQAAVEQEVFRCTAELEALWQQDDDDPDRRDEIQRLQRRLTALQDLQGRCSRTGTELLDDWNRRCGQCDRLAADGRAEAGRYLQKLNNVVNVFPSAAAPVRTVILDSARYPQTAEHIGVAVNLRGHPDVVTLDRDGAAKRRSQSLSGRPARSDFDRDEYPCAMFAEGGAGADVAYIEGSDNRGAGSAIQWQVRQLPDGTRVRIRII